MTITYHNDMNKIGGNFMYYNLNAFGKKVREIRNLHNLTRQELSNLSFVSIETIRKIETGSYLPSHKILDDLSTILKIDLNQILLKFRLDDFQEFNKIKNRLEAKFDRDEFSTLYIEYDDLNKLLNNTNNTYFQTFIQQLILLTKAVILYKKEDNYQESLDTLIKAMKVSIPKFTLAQYQSFIYNSTELRILMNMALVLRRLETKEKSLEIMEFCIDQINPNNKIYSKLCYNISGIYFLNKKYRESLKYSNLGIEYCLENRELNGINLLYYIKGLGEYKDNPTNKKYMDSLNKSLYFCKVLDQDNLKKVIINNCKKFHNIEL